jgi:hypothetical protein
MPIDLLSALEGFASAVGVALDLDSQSKKQTVSVQVATLRAIESQLTQSCIEGLGPRMGPIEAAEFSLQAARLSETVRDMIPLTTPALRALATLSASISEAAPLVSANQLTSAECQELLVAIRAGVVALSKEYGLSPSGRLGGPSAA